VLETSRLPGVVLLVLPALPDFLAVLHSRAQLGWPQWLAARSAAAPPDEFERTRLT
jgi:hypothetical protein